MKLKVSELTERLKKRFHLVCIVFVAILAILVVRLFWIEIINGDDYSKVTLNRSETSSVISARRGNILDKNNVLLASSTMEYTLILDPAEILTEGHNYLDITSKLIEKCFGISASEVAEKAYASPNKRYIILKKNLVYSEVKDFIEMMEATSAQIREFLELPSSYEGTVETAGAWLEESYKRNYPYGTLASSVLGFMENEKGTYGIEKYYESELSGTDGIKYTYLTNDNVVESVYKNAEDGNSVQLTIDYNIQSIVEKHIMEMLEETEAKTIAVTIQDPNTGEFLAMADTGIFDSNSPRDLSVLYTEEEIDAMSDSETAAVLNENWKNYCVTETYEPGSTFKVFTVAGALEEGSISTDQIFYCDGSISMLDYTIHCANIAGHGYISLTTALAESCNMAMIDIANAEGIDIFCKYQSKFGFGILTGIDLPTEMSCKSLLYTRENMTDIDLATNSFGQSFNVTMVQLSTAFCSIVNGGTYYKPYIVKGIYNSNGEMISSTGKTVVSKPISQDTADFVKQALRYVVTEGTGTDAVVPGYITAGKTGTAEKGNREDDLWLASFIGFAPYENPEVVCYVVIDEPASGGDGSSAYACELFSRIMAEVLPYLNATPASMDYDPSGVGSPDEIVYEYDDSEDTDLDDDFDNDESEDYENYEDYEDYEESYDDYDTYDYEEYDENYDWY